MINNKIFGLIGLARKAGKVSFGTEASIEAIEKKKAKLVIVAEDSADRTKRDFEFRCEKGNILIKIFGTINELSKCIGQNNKAIICINDINFSNEIVKTIDGGEFIG